MKKVYKHIFMVFVIIVTLSLLINMLHSYTYDSETFRNPYRKDTKTFIQKITAKDTYDNFYAPIYTTHF